MEIDITEKVTRRFRGTLIVVIVLAVCISGGIWFWQQQSTYLTIDARVAGVSGAVSAKTEGVVAEVLVADGEQVEAGQLLATLEIKVSERQVEELAAALESAKKRYTEALARPQSSEAVGSALPSGGADVQAAKAQLDRAATDLEKMDKLFALGAISAVQRNQSAAAYQAALSAFSAAQSAAAYVPRVQAPAENKSELVKIAQLQVKQAEAAYEQSKFQRQSANIFAPVSGIIEIKGIEQGVDVTPGQALFSISNSDDMWVEAKVSEADAAKITLGRFAAYTISDYPGTKFEGTVYEITDVPEETETVQIKIVRISLPANSEVVFRPGMNVRLKIGA